MYFCGGIMKKGRQIIQVVMLLCSFVLLLSVIVPHHHHRDGMVCYKFLKTEATDGDHGDDTRTCCGCGHNLFVMNAHSDQVTGNDVDSLLIPLMVLFDYINPYIAISCWLIPDREYTAYIELLHSVWITDATGLRAPPVPYFLL